jgi:CheY-like chemotaxis protein
MQIMPDKKAECILVVDDSPDNLQLLQFILEDRGYRVGLADNGEEALKKAERCHPDLILLDVMMPQMNGYEVVHQLRENHNLESIPVFFVTADLYIDQKKAIAAGANGLIHKPIDIEELLSEVELVFNSRENLS